MKRALPGFALVLSLCLAGAAHADDAGDAHREFSEGKAAFDAKNFEEAALHFETAAELAPHAIAYFSAATAWDKVNKHERAADAYARAIVVGGLPADRMKRAQDRLDVLEREVGTLVATVPQGARANIDDFPQRGGVTELRLHATAGPHVVTVRIPNKPPIKRDITLVAGTPLKETFSADDVDAKPGPVADGSPNDTPPAEGDRYENGEQPKGKASNLKMAGLVTMGVGGGLLAVAGVLAVMGFSATEDYNNNPTQDGYDSAKTLETMTNLALVTGLGAAIVGAGIWLWAPSTEPAPKTTGSLRFVVSPRGAALGGTF